MAELWTALASGALLLPLVTAAATNPCSTPTLATDSVYAPGQVWSYRTRTGEESATVTTLRVETMPKLGVIVHVRLDGIHLHNCTGGPSPQTIEYAPFTRGALAASLLRKLEDSPALPDYAAGYADWRRHCGGVYSIPVAEMVAADDATFQAGLGCTAGAPASST